MSKSGKSEEKLELNIDDIAVAEHVIHPALDWVNGQLIVGVKLKGNKRGVISSQRGLVSLEGFGLACERAGQFESSVTPAIARAFTDYLKGELTEGVVDEARELLESLAAYFKRFIIFPDEWWPQVLATWVLGTYLYPMFQAYPYLHITSPVPGCGKSLLGQIVANLSFNGEMQTSFTEATVFRQVELNRGVQVWDEAERKEQPEIKRFASCQDILLNGYRNGGIVPRTEGDKFTLVKYHVYCPRVLIGLSALPEPVRQRTIQVVLRKRRPDEEIELYIGDRQRQEETDLKGRCLSVALKCAERVNKAYQNSSLRSQLERLLGQVGRESDDIWLPVFSTGAATVDSNEVEWMQAGWLQGLATAAKELASRRARQSAQQALSQHPKSPTTEEAHSEEMQRSFDERVAIAALNTLEWIGPVEPEKLAKNISDAIGEEVAAQRLGKILRQYGIEAKKRNGRRLFKVTPEKIAAIKGRLSLTKPVSDGIPEGQEGQEGQVGERGEVNMASMTYN